MCLVVAIQGGRKLEMQNLMSTFRLNSIIPARNICLLLFFLSFKIFYMHQIKIFRFLRSLEDCFKINI